MKFGDNMHIDIQIDAMYLQYSLPPFALQMVVENAFKHNMISSVHHLTISMLVRDEMLVVKNNLQQRLSKLHSTNIGQKNIIRRYKLLSDVSPRFVMTEKGIYCNIAIAQPHKAVPKDEAGMTINCIIIEDEYRTAQHLENQLALSGYEIQVLDKIDTVERSVAWLKQNTADLIFMDIELGDGLSFEIFDHVALKTPVVFATSFNQYITKAFDVNSISYLLKPVNQEGLRAALEKFKFLYEKEEPASTLNEKNKCAAQWFSKAFPGTVRGWPCKSIMVSDIAYFQVQNKRFLILTTKDRQQRLLDTTHGNTGATPRPGNVFQAQPPVYYSISMR